MLDLLNENAPAIQAICTALLLGVTAVYAALTFGLLREAHRSRYPYVTLDLSSQSGLTIELSVSNHGLRAANNVAFEVQTNLIDKERNLPFSECEPFVHGIPYLPPRRRLSFFFLVDQAVFEGELGDHTLTVDMEYEGPGTLKRRWLRTTKLERGSGQSEPRLHRHGDIPPRIALFLR